MEKIVNYIGESVITATGALQRKAYLREKISKRKSFHNAVHKARPLRDCPDLVLMLSL